MTSTLRADDVSVEELFSGNQLYEIPAFQRDYSWTETQAQSLLDDIISADETAREATEQIPMFLGNMLFVEPEDPDLSLRCALVVDGQQRLVTLTILLCVLRDQLTDRDLADRLNAHISLPATEEEAGHARFHVQPRASDARFLQHTIQRIGATRLPRGKADYKPVNEPQRRMEAVRAYFAHRIKQFDPERQESVARFTLSNCRVMRIWAPDIDYAYRHFLSIHKPGLPLREEDIILAEVVGPLAIDQRRRFDVIIEQMTRYREPQAKGKRQDKTFFTHLATAQRWSRSNRMITLLKRVVAQEGGPMQFASRIFEPMAEAYLMTRGNWPREAHSEEFWTIIDGLRLLECFCDSEWVAPAMVAIAKLKDDEVHLCELMRALDRHAYMLALTRATAEDRRKSYEPILDRMWQAKTFPATEDLFAVDEPRQVAAVRKAALKLNESTANGLDKAILIRLDAHISGRPISHYLDLIETKFTDEKRLTLEHILPNGQQLAKSSPWRTEYAQYRYRRAMSNTIGNLILLEQDRNKAAGQAEFGKKKQAYFSGDNPHDLALTEAVREASSWNRQTLEERYQQLMNGFLEVWPFDAPIPELPNPPGSDGSSPPGSGGIPPFPTSPAASKRPIRKTIELPPRKPPNGSAQH
ncbi:MAG: DUF262 domain-containing HNH endonuclease family protein [Filomicrobium sp.]